MNTICLYFFFGLSGHIIIVINIIIGGVCICRCMHAFRNERKRRITFQNVCKTRTICVSPNAIVKLKWGIKKVWKKIHIYLHHIVYRVQTHTQNGINIRQMKSTTTTTMYIVGNKKRSGQRTINKWRMSKSLLFKFYTLNGSITMTIALGDFVTLFVLTFRDWPFNIGTYYNVGWWFNTFCPFQLY